MAIIGSWSLKNEELTVEVKADLKNIYWSDALGHLKLDNLCYEVCLMNKIGKEAKIKMLPEANKALSKLKPYRVILGFPSLGDYRKLKVIAGRIGHHMEDTIFIKGSNNKLNNKLEVKEIDESDKESIGFCGYQYWFSCVISCPDLQYACSANGLLLHR